MASECAAFPSRRDAQVPLVAAALALAAGTVPFLVNWRVGLLGMSANDDASRHLLAVAFLRTDGSAPEWVLGSGYPEGPHALLAAVARLTGARGDLVLDALMLAVLGLTAVTAVAGLDGLGRRRAIAGAVLVALAYLPAAYFAQAAFKETLMAFFALAFALQLRAAGRAGPAAARTRRRAPRGARGRVRLHVQLLRPRLAAGDPRVLGGGRSGARARAGARASRARGEGGAPVGRAARGHDRARARRRGRAVRLGGVLARGERGDPADRGRVHRRRALAAGGARGLAVGRLAARAPALGAHRARGADLRCRAGLRRWSGGCAGATLRFRPRPPPAPAAYLVLVPTQSAYVSAKALVIVSPIILLLCGRALFEPSGATARSARTLLAVAFTVGAVGSTLLALRTAQVGTDGHRSELAALTSTLNGRSAIYLATDEYAGWRLFGVDFRQPGGSVPVRPEKAVKQGDPLDFDVIDGATLDGFDYVITTRAAYRSAPPANLRLVRRTASYELWERDGATPARSILPEGPAPGAVLDCGSEPGAHGRRRPRERLGDARPGDGGPAGDGAGRRRRARRPDALAGTLGDLAAVPQPSLARRARAGARPRPCRRASTSSGRCGRPVP